MPCCMWSQDTGKAGCVSPCEGPAKEQRTEGTGPSNSILGDEEEGQRERDIGGGGGQEFLWGSKSQQGTASKSPMTKDELFPLA